MGTKGLKEKTIEAGSTHAKAESHLTVVLAEMQQHFNLFYLVLPRMHTFKLYISVHD